METMKFHKTRASFLAYAGLGVKKICGSRGSSDSMVLLCFGVLKPFNACYNYRISGIFSICIFRGQAFGQDFRV